MSPFSLHCICFEAANVISSATKRRNLRLLIMLMPHILANDLLILLLRSLHFELELTQENSRGPWKHLKPPQNTPNHPKPLQHHPKPPHNTFNPSQNTVSYSQTRYFSEATLKPYHILPQTTSKTSQTTSKKFP